MARYQLLNNNNNNNNILIRSYVVFHFVKLNPAYF